MKLYNINRHNFKLLGILELWSLTIKRTEYFAVYAENKNKTTKNLSKICNQKS